MNDPKLNLLLVAEVEKRPILYNTQLPGYSRKPDTEKAWLEISNVVNMSVSECKDKWRNIRTVFVRHMKLSQKTNKKRAYYLSDVMQFTVPYIKALASHDGSLLPSTKIQEEYEEEEEGEYNDDDDDDDSKSFVDIKVETMSASPPQPMPPLTLPPSASSLGNPTEVEGSFHGDHLIPFSASSVPIEKKKKKKKRPAENSVMDEAFLRYLDVWGEKQRAGLDTRTEGLRMFLLSMLPDLQQMSDAEVRQFKRRALDAVDDIMESRS